jgi:hypothetical protein
MVDTSSPTTDQADALPRRSELIGEITNLFRVARRQVNPLDAGLVAGTSAGHLVLDADGARRLHRLVTKLVSHEYFEHLSEQEIELALMKLVGEYQAGQRDAKMAANFIDQTAKAPCQSRVFFGVRHLTLPQTVDLGIARFLTAGEADFLRPVLGPDVFAACSTYCEVVATGGTTATLTDRARDQARRALSLLRLHLRHALRFAHRDQLLFELHSHYVVEYANGILLWGWRRDPEPIGLDLSGAAEEWTATLEAEGHTLANLARPFRDRVDTALEWMEVASRERSWKVKIPAIFSAIEALLVPEDCSHKAEVVTVRPWLSRLPSTSTSPAQRRRITPIYCAVILSMAALSATTIPKKGCVSPRAASGELRRLSVRM